MPFDWNFTQRRSIVVNVGYFRWELFVCVRVCGCVYFRTSKHRTVKLGGRCIVQKSRPSLNLGVIVLCNFVWIAIMFHIGTYLTIQSHSPGDATFPACWRSHCSRQ